MKNIIKLVLSAAMIVLFAFSNNEPLPIGAAIPKADSKLKDVSGKEVTFAGAMQENGLLVMFSCNTCPVVKKYQARTLEAARDAASRKIGVVLVNSNEGSRDNGDSFEDMKSYAAAQGYRFNYVLDERSAMADAFGAMRTPEVFLFNGKGLLVYHGAIDDNPNSAGDVSRKHLGIALEELTSGRQVSTTQTRSVGCGIKRP